MHGIPARANEPPVLSIAAPQTIIRSGGTPKSANSNHQLVNAERTTTPATGTAARAKDKPKRARNDRTVITSDRLVARVHHGR